MNAHSVQRSGAGLAAIARKGHVYGYKVDFTKLDRTGGRLEPSLIGTRDASTFTGFCGYHDSETFAPLEREVFAGSPLQIALLGYRALCKEIMAKRSSVALNPTLREGDRGLPPRLQRLWQAQMDAQQIGFDLSIRDLERAKERFEHAIMSGDYSGVHSLTVYYDAAPTVLATSPLTPEFDFDGTFLQDLNDLDKDMEVLAYSLVGTGDGRGAAVFCWMGDSPVAERFVASVERMGRDVVAHRLVQFSFEYFENIYWAPDWWESLDERTRKTLIDRMNAQVWTIRGQDCLRDDGTRSAAWSVVSFVRS